MFQLGRVSRTKPHLLADTVEISIAFGSSSEMSMTDLLGIIRQAPRAAEELLPVSADDIDDDGEPDGFDETEKTERQQAYVEETWRQLAFRMAAFGDAYPFVVEGELCKIKPDLKNEHCLYLLLLACSRTRSFLGKGITQRLADTFEEICAVCLKHMMSPSAQSYMFGPNSADRANIFGSNLQNALPKLAEVMKMRLNRAGPRTTEPQATERLTL